MLDHHVCTHWHYKLYLSSTAIFKGDPQDPYSEVDYMDVSSDENSNVWASDPKSIPPFLVSTQLLYRDTPTKMQIGMRKSQVEY